jgi:hypothetical protein
MLVRALWSVFREGSLALSPFAYRYRCRRITIIRVTSSDEQVGDCGSSVSADESVLVHRHSPGTCLRLK